MKSRIDEMAEQLASLNIQIRHDMEQAEAKAERVNQLVHELGETGVLTHQVLLGVVFERAYDPESSTQDSGQVVQAALLVPEGFGVCLWDLVEFTTLRASPQGLERHARAKFQPFDECAAAEKKFLLPYLEEMLEDLTDVALVAASKLDAGPGMAAEAYFAQRQEGHQQGPVE